MKKLILLLLIIPALCFGQYIERPLPTIKPYAQVFGYTEHVPSKGRLPLLIALGGQGEKGNGRSDLYKVLNPGIGSLIKHCIMPVDSFIVLLPQSPNYYFDVNNLHKFIEYAKKNYNVDTTRIYITGLSWGGISVYNYLRKYSCTAAIPVAGSGTAKYICTNGTTRTPVWAFHGESDGIVKPGQDVIFVREYNKCQPAESALLTTYPSCGHDSWTETYKNKEVYYWLLRHRTTYKSGI